MIEAVNSVLSNANVTRVAAEQLSTTRSFVANPEKTQEVARAPYVSPHISIDRSYNRAVLQIRDSETGDVVRQFPTEGQLRAYRDAQQTTERQERREVLSNSGGDQPSISSTSESNAAQDVTAPSVPSVETEA